MSQSAKSLYTQACKNYFPFLGEPKYKETLTICQEICDKFPTSPEYELAKIRIGQIREIKPDLFPDNIAINTTSKQSICDKAATNIGSPDVSAKYDKYFKILGINRSNTCDLESKYYELKKKWELENFISSPEMYERAMKINADIDEAYELLKRDTIMLNSIATSNKNNSSDSLNNYNTNKCESDKLSVTAGNHTNNSSGFGGLINFFIISYTVIGIYFWFHYWNQSFPYVSFSSLLAFPFYSIKGALWPIFIFI